MYTIHKKQPTTLQRTSLDFAVIYTALVMLTLFMGLVLWQFWHTNRIYQGISISGVPIGGLTRATALNELQNRLQTYPLAPINLTHGEQQWPLSAQQFDMELDLGQAINRAYLVGRDGGSIERWVQQLVILFQGYDIEPSIAVNTVQMRAAISQIARQVYQPGKPAQQVGELKVPAQWGTNVDVDMTMQSLLNLWGVQPDSATQMALYPSDNQATNLPLYVVELPPPDHVEEVIVASAESEQESPFGQQAVALLQPLLLHDEASGVELAIDAGTLQSLITQQEPRRLDEARLRELITGWSEQFSVPPQDARLHFDPASELVTVVQESQPGRRLDIVGTMRSIEKAV